MSGCSKSRYHVQIRIIITPCRNQFESFPNRQCHLHLVFHRHGLVVLYHVLRTRSNYTLPVISLTVIPGYFLLLKYSPLFLSALSFHIRSTLHNSNTLQQYVFKLMASIPPVGLYQVHIRAKGLESPPIQNIV